MRGVSRLEAGISLGWERWVGDRGDSVSIERYGASAPYERCSTSSASTSRTWRSALRRCWRASLMRVAAAFDHRGVKLRDACAGAIERRAARPSTRRRLGRRERGLPRCGARPRYGVRRASPCAACSSAALAWAPPSRPRRFPASRAVCHETYPPHQAVEHDDMNVLCLGARSSSPSSRRARACLPGATSTEASGSSAAWPRFASSRRCGRRGRAGRLRPAAP